MATIQAVGATADVNGVRLAFDDTGGDGPVVLLSHGFLMDRTMFDDQVAALRHEYRVITWDERGFGQTVYDERPFTYWDSARDCLARMEYLEIERAVLGGMSQGGFIALRAALPDLQSFWPADDLAAGGPLDPNALLRASLYATLYTGGLLCFGTHSFRRRQF